MDTTKAPGVEFFKTEGSLKGGSKDVIYLEHEGEIVKIVGGKVISPESEWEATTKPRWNRWWKKQRYSLLREG